MGEGGELLDEGAEYRTFRQRGSDHSMFLNVISI